MKLNVAYDFRAKQPSCRAAVVMDHFGIGFETGAYVIAEDWELPIRLGMWCALPGRRGRGNRA